MNPEKRNLPTINIKKPRLSFNNSNQIREIFSNKRANQKASKTFSRDPLIQTNDYWTEKSIRLPNFMNTSCARYNIINHTPKHQFYIKNVSKLKGVTRKRKALAEFCDYDKVTAHTHNKVYRVS